MLSLADGGVFGKHCDKGKSAVGVAALVWPELLGGGFGSEGEDLTQRTTSIH